MPKLIPLGTRILCEPLIEAVNSVVKRADSEKEDKKLRPEKGRVIAVGENYEGKLKKGDIVYFSKYECEWIEIKGKEFIVGIPDYFYLIEQ